VVALNVYRTSHVRVDVCNSDCLVLWLESVMYLKTVTEQQKMKLDARIVTNTVQL